MKRIDFENGSVTQNIFAAALPMLVAQILNLLYNIVDRIYIARIPHIGTAALGAVGLCFPLVVIITAFAKDVYKRQALSCRSSSVSFLKISNVCFNRFRSSSVISWRPSQTKTMTSASWMAISAWDVYKRQGLSQWRKDDCHWGDGTINEVINGLTNLSKWEIGIIPAGSGNDIAAKLNIRCV